MKKFFSKKPFLVVSLSALLAISSLPAFGAQEDVKIIVVKAGQSIRTIAKKYLKNADLWMEILKANDLKSAAEIRPGMKIKIPTGMITSAEKSLARSLKAIQKATKEGARMFAPKVISKAISLRDKAILKKKESKWRDCTKLAIKAEKTAQMALKESRSKSVVTAQAILNYRKGSVQSRKVADLLWNNLPVSSLLTEKEKVRTLSESMAEILFRDESRLKLSANSQAIIQQMQVNVLEKKEKSSVTLIEGDIHIILAGRSKKKKFDLKIAGLKTKVDSSNFWVNRDKKGTKFANYEGKLEVSSKVGKVLLKKNEGSVVRGDMRPTAAKKLLTKPMLLSPETDSRFFKDKIALEWKPVKDASIYWVEIGFDKSNFDQIVMKRKKIKKTTFTVRGLKEGVYYWRLAAVDNLGFPGPRSDPRWFRVIKDETVPYIVVNEPEEKVIVSKNSILVSIETEKDAILKIGGKKVKISENGKFVFNYPLEKGINRIAFKVTDQAGNETDIVRSVVYCPETELNISSDPSLPKIGKNQYAAQDTGFTLRGSTEPDTSIAVQSARSLFRASTFADKKGDFQLNIPLKKVKNEFLSSLTSPTGFVTKDTFSVVIDKTPPEIYLDEEVPDMTIIKKIHLAGYLKNGERLFLNGKNVKLSEGRFDEYLGLSPGRNKIIFTASNQVGNTVYLERNIIFDRNPPKYMDYTLSHRKAAGGEIIYLKVAASDETRMRRAAKFAIRVGKHEFPGFMKLCHSTNRYEGVVNLPQWAVGNIKLSYLRMADYLGNDKEYFIKN